MTSRSPASLMASLVDARACRDVEPAVACYENDAAVLPKPGKRLTGLGAIREFTAATLDLPIEFGTRQIVEGDGIALYVCAWGLEMKSGGPLLEGSGADMLR
ncbi:hypothetical protein [Caballeronia sordidicola]|jgi:hypothetical protein|uniref:hypothetical protein n=1 Tax=Caballeronia sordidicola TaxID=196367 RepID=UPI00126A2009|nr:hypothetical protein [Caballeronia sordidicola]